MDKHDYLRIKIRDHLAKIREKNPRLSERYFAGVLGVAPSTFSEFMSGKRLLSEELIDRVCSRLDVSHTEKSELQKLPLKKKSKIATFETIESFLDHTRKKIASRDTYRFVGELAEDQIESKLLVSLSERRLSEVQEKITKLKDQIIRIAEEQDESSKKKVYRISFNLFSEATE